MLKLETTWARNVTTDEGRPVMTETIQWWGDGDDQTWMHCGYQIVGRNTSRAFVNGFDVAYIDQQREFLTACGWTEIKPGTDGSAVNSLTVGQTVELGNKWRLAAMTGTENSVA